MGSFSCHREHLRHENLRNRVWIPATKAACVAPLRIYDLRHTCATLAVAAGADILALQRMLGHASAAMTLDRYCHLMPGQAESFAQRLSQAAFAETAPPATGRLPIPTIECGSVSGGTG